jgi:hypothetical protein
MTSGPIIHQIYLESQGRQCRQDAYLQYDNLWHRRIQRCSRDDTEQAYAISCLRAHQETFEHNIRITNDQPLTSWVRGRLETRPINKLNELH